MLEALVGFSTGRGWLSPEVGGPLAKAGVLACVSYGLLANLRLRSLWFVWLGFALNTLVIVANRGHMPVWLEAVPPEAREGMAQQLTARSDAVHSLMTPDTPFYYLGDILPVYWAKSVLSLGDVYLIIGIAALVLELGLEARRQRRQEWNIDIRFDTD
ncbi:DUF5317 domain-containing protein [Calidithermus chliarophilus]|uniref:DUF5317 domain-containing protein n=1 Tax=Calidithermus chliarophilus TaxID=52023 RepID=UPI000402C11C|nr:DUF5317 domain-containing protein [Calidithermus chliarophilus]